MAARKKTAHFSPDLFKFLRQLERHNERAWFEANRERWIEDVRDPMLHFVAVIWPKGTDPNETACYIDAWETVTKYGYIQEFTFMYSWSVDGTPTIEYEDDRGYHRVPLFRGNPWVF